MEIQSNLLPQASATVIGFIDSIEIQENVTQKAFAIPNGNVDEILQNEDYIIHGVIENMGDFSLGQTCSQIDSGKGAFDGNYKTTPILPYSKGFCFSEKDQRKLARAELISPNFQAIKTMVQGKSILDDQINTLGYNLRNPESKPLLKGILNLEGVTVPTIKIDLSDPIKTLESINELRKTASVITGASFREPDILMVSQDIWFKMSTFYGANYDKMVDETVDKSLGIKIIKNWLLPNGTAFMYRKENLVSYQLSDVIVREYSVGFDYKVDLLTYNAGVVTNFPEEILKITTTSSQRV